jgi:hypothetical protein
VRERVHSWRLGSARLWRFLQFQASNAVAKIATASGSKELSRRNGIIDTGHHPPGGTSREKTNATTKPICRRPFSDEPHDIVRLSRGAVGNVYYQLTYFLRIGPGKVKCDALADKSITFAGCLD